jgi:hypothetical protein
MGGFIEWMAERFGKEPSAPEAPGDFRPALPKTDHDAEPEGEHLEESDLQGQSFIIEYRDSVGEVSNRRITIRSLKRTDDGHLCLCAVCWERNALRSFRVDRILSLKRLSDPVAITDPVAFFEQYLHDNHDAGTSALLKGVRPGLRVLVYLSRCDGFVHPREIDAIREYLAGADATAQVPWEKCQAFLSSQHPDKELAKTVLGSALRAKKAAPLLNAAKRLIEADGVVTPEEIGAMESINHFARAATA